MALSSSDLNGEFYDEMHMAEVQWESRLTHHFKSRFSAHVVCVPKFDDGPTTNPCEPQPIFIPRITLSTIPKVAKWDTTKSTMYHPTPVEGRPLRTEPAGGGKSFQRGRG